MKPRSQLQLEITKENYERAVRASSAACVVADAIKEQYPKFSNVKVNVATIRMTDKQRGYRYLYLTPPSAAELILAFDQGWPIESFPRKLRVRTLVKVIPMTISASMAKRSAQRKTERLAKLQAKVESGETLTDGENRALGKLRTPRENMKRPTSYGPTGPEVIGDEIVARGGPLKVKYEKYDTNLLRERDRHFAAKVAQPSEVFKQAVEEAVKTDRAKQRRKSKKQ
jgi:hypothetical protein